MESEARTKLEQLSREFPSLSVEINRFLFLFLERQWHQLSQELLSFVSQSDSFQAKEMLVESFLKLFSKSCNQLIVAKIGIAVVESIPVATEKISFLDSFTKRQFSDAPLEQATDFLVARLFCDAYLARYRLKVSVSDCILTAKEAIKEFDSAIERGVAFPPVVISEKYRLASAIAKKNTNYVEFYENALSFLAEIDISQVHADELRGYAHDLCIAVLLAPRIYNFSDLVMHLHNYALTLRRRLCIPLWNSWSAPKTSRFVYWFRPLMPETVWPSVRWFHLSRGIHCSPST